jgi:hypothetical protein
MISIDGRRLYDARHSAEDGLSISRLTHFIKRMSLMPLGSMMQILSQECVNAVSTARVSYLILEMFGREQCQMNVLDGE